MSHNSKGLNKILTKEYLIEEHYNKKRSVRDIAREHNCSHTNVSKYLKRFGIKNKTKIKGNEYARIYNINHDYFEIIDSHEKAYWFGFVYADGYVMKKGSGSDTFRVTLAKRDEAHLEKLRNKFGDMKISNYTQKGTGHKAVYFSVSSSKLISDMEKLNMTFPKFKRKGLPYIQNKYFYSFLLGVFDGDGSIVVSNNIPTITVLGHIEFVEWLRKKLKDDGFIFNGVNIHKLQGIYRLSFSSQKNIPLFYRKVYIENDTPYLKRKRIVFDKYLSSIKI